MELINATKMLAGYTQGTDTTSRESLVVVVKGTFTLPLDGSAPKLADVQEPIVEADVSSGEPGFSATVYESEYAPYKPRCDVLLNGSAYAPKGKSARTVPVGLKVSTVKGVAIEKVFNVVGVRTWIAGVGISCTPPQAFKVMPFSYDVAFGGMDNFSEDEEKRNAYMPNPIGCGYHHFLDNKLVNGTPLPNTEARGQTVTFPDNKYEPMGLGVIGRSWPERVQHAGTYDQHWVDNTFPFLPPDFDERYYQSAPQDQQCDYLQGGEVVQLVNLTPTGHTTFRIPKVDIPVVFFRKRGEDIKTRAEADNLMIEPDRGIFTITWRAREPLKKNIFEIREILVGRKSRGWWRAKVTGKAYYPSLAHISSKEDDD